MSRARRVSVTGGASSRPRVPSHPGQAQLAPPSSDLRASYCAGITGEIQKNGAAGSCGEPRRAARRREAPRGAARSFEELQGAARSRGEPSREEPQGSARSCEEPRGASRSFEELQRAARSRERREERRGAARSREEFRGAEKPPRAARSREELRGVAKSRGASWSREQLRGVVRSFEELQGAVAGGEAKTTVIPQKPLRNGLHQPDEPILENFLELSILLIMFSLGEHAV